MGWYTSKFLVRREVNRSFSYAETGCQSQSMTDVVALSSTLRSRFPTSREKELCWSKRRLFFQALHAAGVAGFWLRPLNYALGGSSALMKGLQIHPPRKFTVASPIRPCPEKWTGSGRQGQPWSRHDNGSRRRLDAPIASERAGMRKTLKIASFWTDRRARSE